LPNILDYVAWRGDLDFKTSPLNEVDIVALSQIVMLDLSHSVYKTKSAPLHECAHRFEHFKHRNKELGIIIPQCIKDLFLEMANTVRYRDLHLSNYIEDIDVRTETQFSALTVDAEELGVRLVIFSGTDDTIVGWKENFNLIYKTPTEAQLQSVKYINRVCHGFEGEVLVLGHSKGGHLAVYSAAYCDEDIRSRIKHIYNLDGPGFPDGAEAERIYRTVENRVTTLLPQDSIIGRLLENGGEFKIVHSATQGIFQHDCFSWQVMRCELLPEKQFCEESDGIGVGLRKVLSAMNKDERERFVEGLFSILFATGCNTFEELIGKSKRLIAAYFKTDERTKSAVNRTMLKILQDKYLRKCIMDTYMTLKKPSRVNDKQMEEHLVKNFTPFKNKVPKGGGKK